MDKVALELTHEEAKSLLAAAEVGMRSGQMLDVLKTTEADLALIEAVTKLHKATQQPGAP